MLTGEEYMNNYKPTCVYPKEFILALRDHPLSRKKPENIDHINVMVKSYNGYQIAQVSYRIVFNFGIGCV